MPESNSTLDDGSEVTQAKIIDLRNQSRRKIGLNGSLGLHFPWTHYPRSTCVIAFKETLLAVKPLTFIMSTHMFNIAICNLCWQATKSGVIWNWHISSSSILWKWKPGKMEMCAWEFESTDTSLNSFNLHPQQGYIHSTQWSHKHFFGHYFPPLGHDIGKW